MSPAETARACEVISAVTTHGVTGSTRDTNWLQKYFPRHIVTTSEWLKDKGWNRRATVSRTTWLDISRPGTPGDNEPQAVVDAPVVEPHWRIG